MSAIPIRNLLDALPTDTIDRLCDRRNLSPGRGVNARREALARSYRGDHEGLFFDLRKEDFVELLGRDPTEIDGEGWYLPNASSYSRDALVRIARQAFCRDGVPSEFVRVDDDDDADDDDAADDDDLDYEFDDGDPDDEDDGIDHRGGEYAARVRADLSFSARDAAKVPHEYQREATETILRSLNPEQPQALQLATGGGKTLVGNNVVMRWLAMRGGPVLWVTKDWRLLYQAARDLRRRHQVDVPARLGGDGTVLHPLPEGLSRGVVYTTIHTLVRRLSSNVFRQLKPSLLVWDESHWGEHSGTGKILTACKRAGIPVLGLTATPREGGRYQVAFTRTYHQLVREGFLAEEKVEEVRTEVPWAPQFRRVGDVTQASLEELATSRRRNEVIVERYLRRPEYGKAIIFACSVRHATALARMFVERGVAARPVHHELGDSRAETDRLVQQALDQFRAGEVKVLVNVAMLTHGIDVPDARTVFLCRPTTSDILFAQMIGRACRRDEGKTFFYVVDFTDNVQTQGAHLRSAKVFFQGAGSGRGEEAPLSRSGPVRATSSRVHAFDPTGAPTWIPSTSDVPEAQRGLWYRQGQSFGVEIELTTDGPVPESPNAEWLRVASELRARLAAVLPGRVATNVIAGYVGSGGGKDTSVWNVEFDASAGWEVTSRVLMNRDGFNEVEDACRVLDEAATDLGLRVNHRTGLHVHLGWLGRSVEELKRAIRLAHVFEPALATLVAPSRIVSFQNGGYDLTTANAYCGPVSTVFSGRVLDGLRSIDDFAKIANDDAARYVTFNVRPLQTIHTVEVRMHSGTLEARKVLAWLSLWQQILWAAAHRETVPTFPDRDVIEPSGDVVALALELLPDGRQPEQRIFLRRLAARRSEVLEQWARHPQLRSWAEHSQAWIAPPGAES